MRKKHAPATLPSPIPRALAPASGRMGSIPNAASIARALAAVTATLGVGVVACSKHEAPTRDTTSSNASASVSASDSVASASVSASASGSVASASVSAPTSSSVVAAVASCSASVHVYPHVPPGGLGTVGIGTLGKYPNMAGGNAPVNPTNATTPKIVEAGLSVQGSESPSAVSKVVHGRIPAIRACYQKGLAADPTLHGVVSTTFHIRADGKVKSATESSSLGNAGVEQCIQRVFMATSFPASEGETTVVYPLSFTTAGDA